MNTWMQVSDFKFPRFACWFDFKGLWRERRGLEIGVEARTIAPVSRTLLADGYESHGKDRSIAQAYFPASNIPFSDVTFDFVLSEHTLEHIGNALRALKEWIRVIKPGGHLILFLPHKDRTNDRLRAHTTLATSSTILKSMYLTTTQRTSKSGSRMSRKLVAYRSITGIYRKQTLPALARFTTMFGLAKTYKEIMEYLGLEVVLCENEVADRTDSFVVVGRKRS